MFQKIEADKVWVAFSTGKHFRYITVHDIARELGPGRAEVLTVFHAFTGSDQTSFFAGKGKVTALEAWKMFDEVTNSFKSLSNTPETSILQNVMPTLERFVVLL